MTNKRIFHHYEDCEEFKAGMWRAVSGVEAEELLKLAIDFTGNAKLYGEWMLQVCKHWPISCEANLSNPNMNRQAWIGHAACCLAIQVPEQITRLAWHHLTRFQQDEANMQADIAINLWESEFRTKESTNKCQKLIQMSMF